MASGAPSCSVDFMLLVLLTIKEPKCLIRMGFLDLMSDSLGRYSIAMAGLLERCRVVEILDVEMVCTYSMEKNSRKIMMVKVRTCRWLHCI